MILIGVFRRVTYVTGKIKTRASLFFLIMRCYNKVNISTRGVVTCSRPYQAPHNSSIDPTNVVLAVWT